MHRDALAHCRRVAPLPAQGASHSEGTLLNRPPWVAPSLQMRVLYKMEGHSDRVTRVCCNGDTVLSGSFDAQVNLWTF